MKIAIVAPPWEKLPTNDHTGIETTITDLSEKLIEKGHKVILFAPKESKSSAKLLEYPGSIKDVDWETASKELRYFYKSLLSRYAAVKAAVLGVDLIHNFTLSGEYRNPIPTIYTVFGPPNGNIMNFCNKVSEYNNNYMVTVSKKQRKLFNEISRKINFIGTVGKSIDPDKIPFQAEKEDYLLFIARDDQKQEVQLARRVCNASDKRLLAVSQPSGPKDFNADIKPWLETDTQNINLQFSEDLPTGARFDFYRKAKATFAMNQYGDPFGIEMIESLACGTPVIALSKGAATEVIEHGKTGFIVDTEAEMVEAVKNIDNIKPEDCRRAAEERFSAEVMTDKYLAIYEKILKS